MRVDPKLSVSAFPLAGIPRLETVIWNTGPGWDRDIANSARTARRDAALLKGFVDVLPRLEVVVLVGGVGAALCPASGGRARAPQL